MNPRRYLSLCGLTLVAFAAATVAAAAPIKVLYFTKSSGFEHSVVRRGPMGEASHSERVLAELGESHDLAFIFSKDGSLFSPEYLAGFDVVFFYTSGNLEAVGTDGNPPISPVGKQALLEWVAAGGGFLAVHAGADTYHTYETAGGNPPASQRGHRYEHNGDASDSYIKMLGGEFIKHGKQQVAGAKVVDKAFPGYGTIGDEIRVIEEWYTLKEFSATNHVLLVMQTGGMEGSDYARPDYPISWAKPYGKGRVWYNAMGHREDVWDAPYYRSMLVGAIEWAGGRAKAAIAPNLHEVAPGAMEIQVRPE